MTARAVRRLCGSARSAGRRLFAPRDLSPPLGDNEPCAGAIVAGMSEAAHDNLAAGDDDDTVAADSVTAFDPVEFAGIVMRGEVYDGGKCQSVIKWQCHCCRNNCMSINFAFNTRHVELVQVCGN